MCDRAEQRKGPGLTTRDQTSHTLKKVNPEIASEVFISKADTLCTLLITMGLERVQREWGGGGSRVIYR